METCTPCFLFSCLAFVSYSCECPLPSDKEVVFLPVQFLNWSSRNLPTVISCGTASQLLPELGHPTSDEAGEVWPLWLGAEIGGRGLASHGRVLRFYIQEPKASSVGVGHWVPGCTGRHKWQGHFVCTNLWGICISEDDIQGPKDPSSSGRNDGFLRNFRFWE